MAQTRRNSGLSHVPRPAAQASAAHGLRPHAPRHHPAQTCLHITTQLSAADQQTRFARGKQGRPPTGIPAPRGTRPPPHRARASPKTGLERGHAEPPECVDRSCASGPEMGEDQRTRRRSWRSCFPVTRAPLASVLFWNRPRAAARSTVPDWRQWGSEPGDDETAPTVPMGELGKLSLDRRKTSVSR